MNLYMPREKTTQGVSFTPELLAQAKARAAEMGVSLSLYIQQLVRANLRSSAPQLDSKMLGQIAAALEELTALKRHESESRFQVAEGTEAPQARDPLAKSRTSSTPYPKTRRANKTDTRKLE